MIGTGLLGFIWKLYKPSEANLLFDGASLVLYMCGVIVYITNIVKGLRVVQEGSYGKLPEGLEEADTPVGTASSITGEEGAIVGREDSLQVLAASNTILALVLVGVLVLQAGQWYAQRKEEAEIAEMDRLKEEKHRQEKGDGSEKSRKKKQ